MATNGRPQVKLEPTTRPCDAAGNTTLRSGRSRMKRLFNLTHQASQFSRTGSLAQDSACSSKKSQWTVSDHELRTSIHGTRRTERRGSSSSDKGPIQCLVVDNDFKAFTTHVEDGNGPSDIPCGLKDGLRHDEEAGTLRRQSWVTSDHSAIALRCRHLSRFLTSHVIPALRAFVHMSFPDKAQELAYQREVSDLKASSDSSNGMPASPALSQRPASYFSRPYSQ